MPAYDWLGLGSLRPDGGNHLPDLIPLRQSIGG